MISCRLKGGIGNMMSQIAFIEYEGKRTGFQTGYWNVNKNIQHLNNDIKYNPSLKHAQEYLTIFKNFHWPTSKPPGPTINCPFTFKKINVINNRVYDGFFQSELYFPDREFILHLFQPSDKIVSSLKKYDELLSGKTCAIHVRRGDFLKLGLHYCRDFQYYQGGMDKLKEPVDRYLIFSDDIPWCKEHFKGEHFYFIENEKDYVELFLQSKCTHNIISSSTFSWWGAYLNTNLGQRIGPQQWFANNKPNDIIPKSWETI